MSYQPLIPLSGVPGWKFLQRTQPAQQKAFESAPEIKRDIEYFEKNIGKVKTAADLVADRRLLGVALGAFGLEGEIDKKAYIRKILEGGTENPTSLANRVTAAGMKDLVNAFGFGNSGGSKIGAAGFTARIVSAYKTRAFESAVGNSNNDMRLAMNFQRELTAINTSTLRKAFEDAPSIKRDVDYFTANIGSVKTAAEFVENPRLLATALAAFGLQDQAGRKGYLRAVLEGGAEKTATIADLDASPEMKAFATAFGFGNDAGAATGIAGLAKRTADIYFTANSRILADDAAANVPAAAAIRDEIDYFAATIGSVKTAAAFVADTDLLDVALKSFGLGSETFGFADASDRLNYIRAALEGETNTTVTLLAPAKKAMDGFVAAFGFANGATALTGGATLKARVAADYKTRAFTAMMANAEAGKPAAVALKRETAALAKADGSGWYSVLSSKPMRTVFETALNLPKEFVQLDIDKQREIVMERTQKLMGSSKLIDFSDPKNMEKLINRFLVMTQIRDSAASSSPAGSALTLLQNMRSGSQGLSNLFASRT